MFVLVEFKIEHVEVARNRERFTDLGITILPSRKCHLINTCAGVRPFLELLQRSSGDPAAIPWPSGAHASVRDPELGVHLPQFFLGEAWMQLDLVDRRNDAGSVDQGSVRCSGSKLCWTPMERIRPWSRRWAKALKVSTNLLSAGCGQWIR